MLKTLMRPVPMLAAAWKQASEQRLGLMAAGVAYFGLLSLFPALAALVALYGLVGDPAAVQEQVAELRRVAPSAVAQIADEQLTRLVAADRAALAFSTVVSVALSIWSANRGVDGFLQALAAVEQARSRGIVKQMATALGFTAGAVVLAVIVLTMLAAVPAVAAFVRLGDGAATLLLLVRWPLLLAAVFAYVALLYRYGPNRARPAWRAVWPPALGATVAWVLASMAMSEYIARVAGLAEAYGSIAGVVVLTLWLYLTAFIFLFGGVFVGQSLGRVGRRSDQPGPHAGPGVEGVGPARN